MVLFALTTKEINVTEAAQAYLSRVLATKETGGGLRLSIRAGKGCAGYEYDLQIVDAPHPGDETLTVGAVARVFIPASDVLKLFGTTIDYRTDKLGNAQLSIENPNETARCGCGESVKF